MNGLPPGWRSATVGEVAETALGKMLDKGKPRGYEHVPYLRNVNVQWGRIDTDDVLTMELADDERKRFGVENGDLLVCEGGEVGRAAIWNGDGGYMAYQKALHRVRPHEGIDARFLMYALEHAARSGGLAGLTTGSTIAHLPQQKMRRVPLNLPGHLEQRRIVEILEDHFSRLDAALKYSEGAQLRTARYVEATVRCAIRDSDGRDVAFDEVFAPVSDGGMRVAQKSYLSSGRTPVIDQGEGIVGGYANLDSSFAANDLPIIVFGDHTRRVKLIDFPFIVGAQGVKLLRAMPGVRPEFGYLLARTADIRSRGYGRHYGLLRGSRFRLPDLAAQARIVRAAAVAEEAGDKVLNAIVTNVARGERLRKSLLAAAFSGNLTGASSDLDRVEELAEAMA